jgi:hypothetical protein
MIWQDAFITVPAAPRYVVEKPYGQRPFSCVKDGLRVAYKAPKYDGSTSCLRAEIQPRTDPDNKVGIRLPRGKVLNFRTGILVPQAQPLQAAKSVLLQWYQKKGLNPPLSVELVRDKFRLVRLWSATDPTTNPNRQTIFEWPCVRGRMQRLRLEAIFSHDSTGLTRVMLDDAFAFEEAGPNCYNCADDILPKTGIYRPGVKEGTIPEGQTTQVVFDEWSIW